ncbi:MAG TPA: hypothetical protein VHS28_05305 [Chloroflexota bacterium]|nr:hypothetical protein [Chloroflexota bacterium]
MSKKSLVPADETVHVTLGIQLLEFHEAESMANQTWAGAEEVLETVDLSKHPSSETALRSLMERGWEADSVTGLLLGIWMRKRATAGEIASDLLALDVHSRRVLTALYAAGTSNAVIQYAVTREGTLMQHSFSRKGLGSAEIRLFPI